MAEPGAGGDVAPAATRRCAACATELEATYGWCGNCRAAYCVACGPAHFCTPGCHAAGCHAGFCVRLVRDGVLLRDSWGMVESGV